jgi:hypothetical protein
MSTRRLQDMVIHPPSWSDREVSNASETVSKK